MLLGPLLGGESSFLCTTATQGVRSVSSAPPLPTLQVTPPTQTPLMERTMSKQNIKLSNKKYEKELYKLQVELCELQRWVKYKGCI